MSKLSEAVSCKEIPADNVYLIYGAPGSGKTTVASSFPKTKDAPLLYIDIMEGGAGVIPIKDRENVVVVHVDNYRELDEIFTDIMRGFTMDGDKKKAVKYSSIVIDSVTQYEFLLKEFLKTSNGKDTMTLNLWGQARDNSEYFINMLRMLYNRTGAYVVAIAHEKELTNEEDPTFNKVIPSLMTASALSLAAKSSYVWYCKVENETVIDSKTNESKVEMRFMTYIDTHPRLLTKCRKPKDMSCPQRVQNITFDRFKVNVLDKLSGKE